MRSSALLPLLPLALALSPPSVSPPPLLPSRSLSLSLLLTLSVSLVQAAKKKRSRADSDTAPAIPDHLEQSCPFWRSEAEPSELSQFAHELERDGNVRDAIGCYVTAIRSHPTHASGWLDLSVALQHDDPRLAIELYRQGVRLKPGDHELYNGLGVLLRTNGRREEAIRHFQQASRLKPTDADAFFRELRESPSPA